MISRIRGKLLLRRVGTIEVLTAGGVAYRIEIPLSVYERLPREGEEVELRTHQVVRDDALVLYGFFDERERALFGRLLATSGVGPRLALTVLSSLSPDRLLRAIGERDTAALRRIPGVGRKTAERLALELADKLDDLALVTAGTGPDGRLEEEAVGALVALGYSVGQANVAVRQALEERRTLGGPELIKVALTKIGD